MTTVPTFHSPLPSIGATMDQALIWTGTAPVADLPTVTVEYRDHQWTLWGPNDGDHIFRSIRTTGTFYEIDLLEHLSRLVNEGDLVLDVGANMGNHTVWFAGVLGCDVRAFEPVPVLAQVLARNVQLNYLEPKVRVEPMAVGNETHHASVTHWDSTNTGQTRLTRDLGGDIHVVALDDLDHGAPVRLLKIDVEGMELAVLEGATTLIDKERPIIVAEAQDPQTDRELRSWFKNHGYEVTGVYNITPTMVAVHESEAFSGQDGGLARNDARIMSTLEQVLERFTRLEHRIDILAKRVRASTDASARADGPSPRDADQVVQHLQVRVRELESRLASMSADPRESSEPSTDRTSQD